MARKSITLMISLAFLLAGCDSKKSPNAPIEEATKQADEEVWKPTADSSVVYIPRSGGKCKPVASPQKAGTERE